MRMRGLIGIRRALAFVLIQALCIPPLAIPLASASGSTLDDVRQRGYLRCGIHRSGAGLADIAIDGIWNGYFVEFCGVIAAAAIGDSRAVRYFEVDDISAMLALTASAVDVVTSTIDPGETDDGHMGIAFLSPILEDQLILVLRTSAIDSVAQIPDGARICASSHAVIRDNLAAALRGDGNRHWVVHYDSIDGLFNAFFSQNCAAVSHYRHAVMAQTMLRSPRQLLADRSQIVLSNISFSPAVRADDDDWRSLVDAALRTALHDATVDQATITWSLREGFTDRIHAIAGSSTAIFDRTLGGIGGPLQYAAMPATRSAPLSGQ